MTRPDHFILHVTEEMFIVEPVYAQPVGKVPYLEIARPSGDLRFNDVKEQNLFVQKQVKVYGIIGMIQLLSGPYLIVITQRKSVGRLCGNDLWFVAGIQSFGCASDLRIRQTLTSRQADDEETYVELLDLFFSTTGVYYSSTYDMTRSFQSQVTSLGTLDLSAIDSKHFLNHHLADALLRAHQQNPASLASHFLAVCIEGFVELQPTAVNQHSVTFGLISRRAVGRIGTRHFSRGIDDDGNVSNFVETEQFVVTPEYLGALVQVRGSIPIYWRQNVNLYYKPPMELYNHAENSKVFKAHFDDLLGRFGRVVAVNLVDSKGFEGTLAKSFVTEVNTLAEPNLRYVHFDFHEKCKKMRWDRISLLVDSIQRDLDEQGYFLLSLASWKVVRKQSGVIRTNCIDCLDRTNVVQGVVAQRAVNIQLHQMGVFRPQETIHEHVDLVWFFKNIWADNGDAISKQYAGTGALKTDYTRTGRRTLLGVLQDGYKSAVRYYKTNFTDGYRQDAMDLFHGRYLVDPSLPSPFAGSAAGSLLLSPGNLLGGLLVLSYLTSWLLAKTGLGRKLPWPLVLGISVLPALSLLAFAYTNGTRFVLYPKLIPPKVGVYASSAREGENPFAKKIHLI